MNDEQMDIAESEILSWLRRSNDRRISMLFHEAQGRDGRARWSSQRGVLYQALWSLLAKHHVFLIMDQSAPTNWDIQLTSNGAELADRSKINPGNPTAYLAHLHDATPQLSETATLYLSESLRAFGAKCFLSSTMMLGVAAEACFPYDVATSFARWDSTQAGSSLLDLLGKPKQAYVYKLTEFQKRLIASKGHLPQNLSENLDLNINSPLELIRLARNEVGHPTSQKVDRETAFAYLMLFPNIVKRLYGLKAFFDTADAASLARG